MKIIRAFIHFICIGMAVLMLGSCDENKGNQVEYLAVQLEEGDSWSIIDKDPTLMSQPSLTTSIG